jgi:hypothetical protein
MLADAHRSRQFQESIRFSISQADDLTDIDAVSAQLVVLGGSYVGVEFAQMFRRFGADVTLIETAPRLVARKDADVSASLKRASVVSEWGHRLPSAEATRPTAVEIPASARNSLPERAVHTPAPVRNSALWMWFGP